LTSRKSGRERGKGRGGEGKGGEKRREEKRREEKRRGGRERRREGGQRELRRRSKNRKERDPVPVPGGFLLSFSFYHMWVPTYGIDVFPLNSLWKQNPETCALLIS
jgi:hypothetical protein